MFLHYNVPYYYKIGENLKNNPFYQITMNIFDTLIEQINKKQSPICIGLDPRLKQIPKFLVEKAVKEHGNTPKAVAEAFKDFSIQIIDKTHDLVPAVKPQFAFWEVYGADGIKALQETIAYAKSKGLIVIADAKRQDIGSTSDAYATSILGSSPLPDGTSTPIFDCDIVTIGPYLGSDSIDSFIKVCKEKNKGVFVLVRTSNPSAKDFQDQKVITGTNTEDLFKIVAEKVIEWGKDSIGEKGFSSVGAVVGATYPEEAKELRKLMPNTFFLVPGYGAQGGGGKDTVPNFNGEGIGAIVNSSRGIIFAYEEGKEEQFADAARNATLEMKKDILEALKI
tara:strand:- start:9018 stop:10028 length:1011 start_codon:yes stop_codon:yes gene_type:complete